MRLSKSVISPYFLSFGLLKNWLVTWRTLPVLAWIRAAELYRQGRYSEAVRLYRVGLERNKRHPARYCATIDLARCLFADGQFDEAEQLLRKLLVKLPGSKTAHTTLFQMQLRMGQNLDAAWTARRALRNIVPEPALIGLYLYCVVENGGPHFLLVEAERLALAAKEAGKETKLMVACRLRLELESKGYSPHLLKELEALADENDDCPEITVLAAEALLRSGKVASARRVLRIVFEKDPTHPRILSLLAETYLLAGTFYNPEFGLQLATESCRRSVWRSPREMHVLAEVYHHLGDALSALVIAEKARDEGSRLLGSYRDAAGLARLIEELHQNIDNDAPLAA